MHRQAELAGQEQGARAEEGRVVGHAAVADPDLATEGAQASAGGLVADGREPRFAEADRRAEDRDVANVERAGQAGQARADGPPRGPDGGEGPRQSVPLTRLPQNCSTFRALGKTQAMPTTATS